MRSAAIVGSGLIGLLLLSPPAFALDPTPPEVHVAMAMQYENFGKEGPQLATSFGPGKDRFAVRHAALEISGAFGPRWEYSLEAGTATCAGGTGFMLMEAGAFYRIAEPLSIGLMKGHILRGFELHDECTDVLTAEKPLWSQTFAPCHPTGAVGEIDISLPAGMRLEGQLALLNGGADGTLEDEHSVNIGLLLRAPRKGLSVGGFFNPVKEATGEFDPVTWEPFHEEGYRFGLGLDFAGETLSFRSEYYRGRCFSAGNGMGAMPLDDSISPGDHEMKAFYIETGYRIPIGRVSIPAVQPYARYQYWDRFSNSEENYGVDYLTAGVTVSLAETAGILRFEYETPVDTPGIILGTAVEEEAGRFIVRMQTSY